MRSRLHRGLSCWSGWPGRSAVGTLGPRRVCHPLRHWRHCASSSRCPREPRSSRPTFRRRGARLPAPAGSVVSFPAVHRLLPSAPAAQLSPDRVTAQRIQAEDRGFTPRPGPSTPAVKNWLEMASSMREVVMAVAQMWSTGGVMGARVRRGAVSLPWRPGAAGRVLGSRSACRTGWWSRSSRWRRGPGRRRRREGWFRTRSNCGWNPGCGYVLERSVVRRDRPVRSGDELANVKKS